MHSSTAFHNRGNRQLCSFGSTPRRNVQYSRAGTFVSLPLSVLPLVEDAGRSAVEASKRLERFGNVHGLSILARDQKKTPYTGSTESGKDTKVPVREYCTLRRGVEPVMKGGGLTVPLLPRFGPSPPILAP
eukprot:1182446-Prorocentrum_minimum.AAC.2